MAQSASVMPYISETVHPNIRGSLVTLPGFMIASGMLLVWSVGYFVSWRMTAYLLLIPPILLSISITFMPETPYWLVDHDKIETAKKSLQFFRGKDYNITEEFDEILQKHESKKNQNPNNSWKSTIKIFCSAAFLKPFSCVGILYIVNTWGGFSQIQIYMIEILERSGSSIGPKIGPIATGFTRLAFAGTYKLQIILNYF